LERRSLRIQLEIEVLPLTPEIGPELDGGILEQVGFAHPVDLLSLIHI